MKKQKYCEDCNQKFEYIVKNINELNEITCPKCGKKTNKDYKKTEPPSKLEKKLDKIIHKILNFYYYFYFIFSVIGIIGHLLEINKLLIISTIICITMYIIELIIGFTRNIFGLCGIIISVIIGNIILKDFIIGSSLGICYMLLISNIIKIIINLIINKLYRKYG